MDWKNILVAALVYTVVAQAFHTAGAILTMDYYTNPAYFPLWSRLMMSDAGPPGAEFFIFALVFGLVQGTVFAASYEVLKKSVPGKEGRRGLNFGLMLFLIVQVPSTLTSMLLLAVPVPLLMAWSLESFAAFAVSGYAFSKLIR
ncbi:MAG: hypothetical protein AB1529_05320 [Candidatus Micrarchaeota archaeon]